MNNNTKKAELIISGDQYTGTTIKLISPTPLNTDPSGKTWFFGIVQTPSNKLLKIIDEIVNLPENVSDENEEKNFVDYSSSDLAAEDLLEAVLQNINSNLNLYMNKKEIGSLISKTNIILGLQNENSLSFASHGDIYAMLVRSKNTGEAITINESYEVLDLLKQSGGDEFFEENDSLFTQLISGEFSAQDTIVLSTENLWNKLIEENLIRSIALLPPASAVEFIKNNLPKWHGGGAVALLLKYTPYESRQNFSSPIATRGSNYEKSISGLVATEEKTEQILSTPGPLKKVFEFVGSLKKKKDAGKFYRQNDNFEKKLRRFLDNLFLIIKTIVLFSIDILVKLFILAKNKYKKYKNQEVPTATPDIKSNNELRKGGFIKWFNALPKKSKIILVLTVFLIFVLTQSIFIFSIKKGYENKKIAYDNKISLIKNLVEEAEASMIYGDDKKAENFLSDAQNNLASLDKKTKYEKEQSGFLTELLNEKWGTLYHIIEVTEPKLIADLGNTNGEFIVESDDLIYILSPSTSSVLKMDPNNGQVSPLVTFINESNLSLIWRMSNEKELMVFQKNHLPNNTEIQLAKAEKFSPQTQKVSSIDCSLIEGRLKDLKLFNDKLYTLNTSQNQILKYSNVSNRFTGKTNWLKTADVNLENALSFALDGSIYILYSDGVIEKFYSGEKTDFSANIPKPLDNEGGFKMENAKIWTSDDVKFIYILDQTHNRIIVFDKNGKIAALYTSPIFNNLKDFVIQEDEHKIHVLNGNQIYGIIASHIDFRKE